MNRAPDIPALQNSRGKTMSGYNQHGATDLLCRQNVIRNRSTGSKGLVRV